MNVLTLDDVLNAPVPIAKELEILFGSRKELLILDVGSCTGEDSLRYKMLLPQARIIAFEPLESNVAVMEEHFNKFPDLNIEYEQLALSDKDGEATFHVSGGNPIKDFDESQSTTIWPKEWNKSSSLLPPAEESVKHFPWLKFDKKVHVKTARLDTYLSSKKIDSIQFIHMDVQGAELMVLKGMGEHIKTLEAIWLEVENVAIYENQVLSDEIHDFLSNNGFGLFKNKAASSLYGDSLYVNNSYHNISFLRARLLLSNIKDKLT